LLKNTKKFRELIIKLIFYKFFFRKRSWWIIKWRRISFKKKNFLKSMGYKASLFFLEFPARWSVNYCTNCLILVVCNHSIFLSILNDIALTCCLGLVMVLLDEICAILFKRMVESWPIWSLRLQIKAKIFWISKSISRMYWMNTSSSVGLFIIMENFEVV